MIRKSAVVSGGIRRVILYDYMVGDCVRNHACTLLATSYCDHGRRINTCILCIYSFLISKQVTHLNFSGEETGR